MKTEIVRWIKEAKKKYGVEAIYIPENDVYSIRYKGRGVHNFDSFRFYHLPKRHRMNLLRALIKVGLNHNSGEKYKNQLILNRKLGKKI